jgi:hypothetical protein
MDERNTRGWSILHVGVLVPRSGIQPDRAAVVVDETGAMFLEEADHGRTSGLRNIENATARFR